MHGVVHGHEVENAELISLTTADPLQPGALVQCGRQCQLCIRAQLVYSVPSAQPLDVVAHYS